MHCKNQSHGMTVPIFRLPIVQIFEFWDEIPLSVESSLQGPINSTCVLSFSSSEDGHDSCECSHPSTHPSIYFIFLCPRAQNPSMCNYLWTFMRPKCAKHKQNLKLNSFEKLVCFPFWKILYSATSVIVQVLPWSA